MLNVQIAQTFIGLITLLLSYGISVTIAGCFAAWVALKMGDETPWQEGFLTLNPMAHIDFLGVFFLLLYKFCWGRFIPMNPFNISGKLRIIKILFAFLSKTIAHIGLGILSLIALIGLFGEQILTGIVPLARAFPGASSYVVAIGLIILSLVFVNALLAVISCIANACGLGVMIWVEKNPHYMGYTSFIMLIIQVLLFYFFGSALFITVLNLIQTIGYWIASCLHLC